MGNDHDLSPQPAWPEIVRKIRARTAARIFVERGASYTTQMELELRAARASAVDAVWAEFDLHKDFPPDFVAQWQLFQVSSQAESKSQFLLRPDLGRKLNDAGKSLIAQRCQEVPALFPLLQQRARAKGWSIGLGFVVRYCRVGIMNDIGDLLAPRVIVLLIGERPGLATAASLSAYMAYCPVSGRTDADRNLISNIHARGIHVEEAADRITDLAMRMMTLKRSGTTLKEERARLPY